MTPELRRLVAAQIDACVPSSAAWAESTTGTIG